jgi:ribosomal protein L21E
MQMNSERIILQEAVDAVAKYGSITEAAKQTGIARKTLSGRYHKAIDKGYVSGAPLLSSDQQIGLDSKLKSIAKEKRELQRKYDELLRIFDTQKQRLSAMDLFSRNMEFINHKEIKVVRNGKSSESTAVLCCSDLHYEETVDPKTVDGLNEYNIEIAGKRFNNIFTNGLKLIEMCRSKSDINTLVLWLGGDLISGYIHEDLIEGNALSPVEASIGVYKMCISAINFLVEHGGFKKIIIVTSIGNHGRTTKKIRISTSVENSFEWLIYNFLMSHYEQSDTVEFKLSRGYFNYLNVYGYNLRFHHGNYIRYAGGVGGITIPLNKAIAEWNKGRKADIDVFGHWHQRLSAKNFVGNGSIIGYGPYSINIKAPFEKPQQTFFLVHPKHGKTVEAPIWVD